MRFTGTWLQEHIPDPNASLPGFKMIKADRQNRSSGKSKGGGIVVLVNNSNSGHVTVKDVHLGQ